jgi:hypothetical protein
MRAISYNVDDFSAETKDYTGKGTNPYRFWLRPFGSVDDAGEDIFNFTFNVAIFVSEDQLKNDPTYVAGEFEGEISIEVEPLNVFGPVLVDESIELPEDGNVGGKPKDEESDDKVDDDEEAEEEALIIERPVIIEQEVEVPVPDDQLRWINGLTGETISGEPPPAGWITRIDGRMYPSEELLDPRIPYPDGSEELEQLLRRARGVNPPTGAKRRGFIVTLRGDNLWLWTAGQNEAQQELWNRSIPFVVADIGPEPNDFKIVKRWTEFNDGTRIPTGIIGFGSAARREAGRLTARSSDVVEAIRTASELSEEDLADFLDGMKIIAEFTPGTRIRGIGIFGLGLRIRIIQRILNRPGGIPSDEEIASAAAFLEAWKVYDTGGKIVVRNDHVSETIADVTKLDIKRYAANALAILYDIEEHGEGELHDRILEPR